MELAGKVAVVTGAGRGIGRALALDFRRRGATVVAADLGEQAAEPGLRPLVVDVGREAEIEALVADVLAHEGRIDLVCSNAGIAVKMDPMTAEAEWRRMVDVNLMSHVWMARRVLPHMLARGDGYLLLTASAAGLLNEVDSAGYAATKHATVGLAEWLAFTYRTRGIRVSVLCPEGVWTAMIADSPYLQANAIDAEEVARQVSEAIAAERFMIATHPTTLPAFQRKAADYEAYVDYMVGLRQRAEAMRQE